MHTYILSPLSLYSFRPSFDIMISKQTIGKIDTFRSSTASHPDSGGYIDYIVRFSPQFSTTFENPTPRDRLGKWRAPRGMRTISPQQIVTTLPRNRRRRRCECEGETEESCERLSRRFTSSSASNFSSVFTLFATKSPRNLAVLITGYYMYIYKRQNYI